MLTDTSATDTDPDEAANHLASLNKKSLTPTKGKVVKQRRISKPKEKVSPKKNVIKKEKRMTKKEKENMGKDGNKKQKTKVCSNCSIIRDLPREWKVLGSVPGHIIPKDWLSLALVLASTIT